MNVSSRQGEKENEDENEGFPNPVNSNLQPQLNSTSFRERLKQLLDSEDNYPFF